MSTPPLVVGGVKLHTIRNKNEPRVARVMERLLAQEQDYIPDHLDIQDIYALALNLLPSRYRQAGSIVLSEPVKDSHIEAAIRRAMRTVRERPNR